MDRRPHSLGRAHPETIPGVLEAVAARRGPAPALDDGHVHLTYSELLARVRQTAACVGEVVGPGERVALWGPNTVDWAVAALAVHFAGGAVVPVNTRYTGPEVDDMVTRSQCRLIFAAHEFLGRGLAGEARELFDPVPVVGLGPGAERGVVALADFLAGGAPGPPLDRRLDQLSPDGVSHVQFTSGTTGRPKGAMLRHRAMVRTTAEWARIVGLRSDDRYPIVAPFSHVGGHKTGLLACLTAGALALPMPTLDVERLAAMIWAGQISILQGPPTMFANLISRFDEARPAPGTVRVAVTGAAVVPPSLVRDIASVLGVGQVLTAYGLTETTGVCTITSRSDGAATVAETSGRPIPGVELKIVDPAGGEAPTGQAGQILVRGDSVMAGYLDDPVATAEAVRDGWLHTGDVGWLGDDGCLRIVDRLKDMVIVGGLNAYPAEIERVLVECPGVEQAAVVGIPDDRLGEVPVAFVVATVGVTAERLDAFCRGRLANYKRPHSYRFVAQLPVNSAGKVVKSDLRRQLS